MMVIVGGIGTLDRSGDRRVPSDCPDRSGGRAYRALEANRRCRGGGAITLFARGGLAGLRGRCGGSARLREACNMSIPATHNRCRKTSAASSRCATCRSRFSPARSTPSSARTAPARPRSSTCCRASCCRAPAACVRRPRYHTLVAGPPRQRWYRPQLPAFLRFRGLDGPENLRLAAQTQYPKSFGMLWPAEGYTRCCRTR